MMIGHDAENYAADLRLHVGAGDSGAGDGNRTRTISLGNWSGCSARTVGTRHYCPKLQVSGVAPVHYVCSRLSSATAPTAVHGQKPVPGKAAFMGFSRRRRGKDSKPRYTAYYRDLRGREVSADAFARKPERTRRGKQRRPMPARGCGTIPAGDGRGSATMPGRCGCPTTGWSGPPARTTPRRSTGTSCGSSGR